MRIIDYCLGERVVSLAKDETTSYDLKSECVGQLHNIISKAVIETITPN